MRAENKLSKWNIALVGMLGTCTVLGTILMVLPKLKNKVQILESSVNRMSDSYTAIEENNTSNMWDISANSDGSVIAILSEDGTLTISGTGDMKDWDSWDNQKWSSDNNEIELKNVIIEEGVTNIGRRAFWGCTTLESVKISKGVTSIGEYAFAYCNNLENIEIPDTVVEFKYAAIYYCLNLKTINIPKSVTNIGMWTFYGCTGLTNIIVDEDNSQYCDENGVLYTKDKKQIIKYPAQKEETQYTVIETVTNIVDAAFQGCNNLMYIWLPNGLETIGAYAFSSCNSLKSIDIPEKVIDIGTCAFSYCLNAENVNISEGVTRIGSHAFEMCEKLTEILIPASVLNIETGAFDYCSALTKITVNEDNANYMDDNGVLYRKDRIEIIKYPEGKKDAEYTILNGTLLIGPKSFADTNLTKLIIPEGVTNIDTFAFWGSNKLININIPSTVVVIGEMAFNFAITTLIERESNITELPELFRRVQIEEDMLYSSKSLKLTNCTIEGNNIKINDDVEYASVKVIDGYLNGLTYVLYYNSWDISKDENNKVIVTLTEDGTLTVTGNGEMDAYKYGTVPWENLKYKIKNVKIEEGITKIQHSIFSCCENLITVEIPSSIITIDDNPFIECTNLTEINISEDNNKYKFKDGIIYSKDGKEIVIYLASKEQSEYIIPEGITGIGNRAFAGCRNLKTINIPEGVSYIGTGAFEFCSNLEAIELPSGIEVILNDLFAYCTSLKNIKLPDTITSICGTAFFECNSLESLKIPNSVTIICYGEFMGCTKLQNVELSNQLTYIESNTFDRCISLSNLIISNKVTYIGENAFDECNNLTIICKSGSIAETHAKENNIKYQLDEEVPEIQIIGDWTSELVKEESATVSVMDNFTGVEEDSLRYLWSTESENVTKDKIINKFTNEESLKIKDATGIYYLWIYAEDKVGNETIERSVEFNLDNSGPTLEVSYSTLEPTNQNIIVTIKADEIIQGVDGWILSSNGQELTKEYEENTLTQGENIIIKDMLENESMVNVKITNIDKILPTFTCNAEPIGNTISVKIEARDEHSGINENSYKYYIKDENSSYGEAIDAESIHVFTDLKYETKYYIKVEVADNAGNMVEKEIEVITPKSDKITSTDYTIDEEKSVISEIKPKTTIEQIVQKLQNDMKYEIQDSKGNVVAENVKIGTGYKIKMENEKTYTLVVTGDSTGDGEADIKDILAINKHRLNKAKLVGEFLEAADVNGDGDSNIKDILQINKFRLGKISEL